MNKPEPIIHKLIDELTQSNYSFALYRLPWTDEPVFVMQTDGEYPESVNSLGMLNDKKGFVIIPFNITQEQPGLIIRPDINELGWDNIASALDNFRKNIPDTGIVSETSHNTTYNTAHCDDSENVSEPDLKAKYIETFGKFINPLKKKEFRKLVLSRCAQTEIEENFSCLDAFIAAANNYPRMMISLCHTPVSGTWLGSTPEIILSGQASNWNTVALAGTMPMQGENMPTEWHKKDKEEQAIVSEYIYKVIKKFSNKATAKGPYTARAGQLVHLKTDFQFTLKNTSILGDLLDALHPTPAVCGLPKTEAYNFILENEGYNRKYYSGIIGWLNPDGITNLYVNLRCMNISGNTATLFAGGGILPSSEANSEWEETQHKMNTMRKCLEIVNR